MRQHDPSATDSGSGDAARAAPIVVTGGLGLLGHEVLRQLAAINQPVRSFDLKLPPATPQPGVEFVQGDLLRPADCARACDGAKVVIHTAAVQYHSGVPRWGRRKFFQQNVVMTRNLVSAALAVGCEHIVMVSSDMTYGMPQCVPIPESAPQRPIGPYGRSKLASERVCLKARHSGFGVTILRPRLIVGPGRLGVLCKLFDRVRAGKSVPVIGRGTNHYQMIAVSDIAAACVRAATTRIEGAFNIGSQDPPPVNELLTELCRRAGSPSGLLHLPSLPAKVALRTLDLLRVAPLRPEQYRIADVDYVLDTRRAQEELGWHASLSDTDMLWAAFKSYTQAGTPAMTTPKSQPISEVEPLPNMPSSPLKK